MDFSEAGGSGLGHGLARGLSPGLGRELGRELGQGRPFQASPATGAVGHTPSGMRVVMTIDSKPVGLGSADQATRSIRDADTDADADADANADGTSSRKLPNPTRQPTSRRSDIMGRPRSDSMSSSTGRPRADSVSGWAVRRLGGWAVG